MTALGKQVDPFFGSDFPRSVDEKQSRNSILTEWIGMGRSGPHGTAKRQLLDCVTLTMVLLSLLFRPGESCFFCFFPPFIAPLVSCVSTRFARGGNAGAARPRGPSRWRRGKKQQKKF